MKLSEKDREIAEVNKNSSENTTTEQQIEKESQESAADDIDTETHEGDSNVKSNLVLIKVKNEHAEENETSDEKDNENNGEKNEDSNIIENDNDSMNNKDEAGFDEIVNETVSVDINTENDQNIDSETHDE